MDLKKSPKQTVWGFFFALSTNWKQFWSDKFQKNILKNINK